MKTTILLLGTVLAIVLFSTPAPAQTMFGSLGNFDMINDTGAIANGFEIELEGVHPADIAYTFGSPYIRYGNPVLTDSLSGTGTIVRYASAFDGINWAVGTPFQDPSNALITGGHQLFFPEYGGDPNYINLPGDHFGVALNGNPTNTIYRWLHGDPSGNLTAAGTNVKIPAPVWAVTPPVNNAAAPAAVQVVVPALPKENPGDLFGEAMWVKVFVTEAAEPAELHHLLVGDPAMPGPTEVEIEWQLLQAGKGGGLDEVDSGLNDLGVGAESVTRRYEFYKYTGRYNEDGEAIDETAVLDPDPNPTVGAFLGGQNAALNLAPFAVPEPSTLALLGMGVVGLLGYVWRRRKQV